MTLTSRARASALTALFAAAALGVSACGSSNDDNATTTAAAGGATTTASTTVACPNGQVRFGVEPYEDPAKLIPAYKTLASALQTALGCPVKVTIVQNYTAEVLAMQHDKLDVAEFGPLGYVFASQRAKAEPLVSFATADGKLSTYTAGIWVKKGSPIKTLADLKGKSLALSELGSTSGDAFPRYALQTEANLDPKKDLKIKYAGGHPQSLLALTKGKVDAAEINSQEQESATTAGQFDASKYTEIWKSAPIPNDPVTVRSDLDPAFKTALTNALLNVPPASLKVISGLLEFNPPGNMQTVTKATYQPLFDLAAKLGLTDKDV